MWETVYIYNNTGRVELGTIVFLISIIEMLIIAFIIKNNKIYLIAILMTVIALIISTVNVYGNYKKISDSNYIEGIEAKKDIIVEGMVDSVASEDIFSPSIEVNGIEYDITPMLLQNPSFHKGDEVRLFIKYDDPEKSVFEIIRIDIKKE